MCAATWVSHPDNTMWLFGFCTLFIALVTEIREGLHTIVHGDDDDDDDGDDDDDDDDDDDGDDDDEDDDAIRAGVFQFGGGIHKIMRISF